MDKLNLKFFTLRILELNSACYGCCLLLDTSNVKCIRKYSVARATPLWITFTLSSDVMCVLSAFIVPSENNGFFEGEKTGQLTFHCQLKPTRHLSTFKQWGGIPHSRHFRNPETLEFQITVPQSIGIKRPGDSRNSLDSKQVLTTFHSLSTVI